MKKIVFLDIDGTIIDVSRGLAEPSALTKYAIKELINNGDFVFIASGRFMAAIPSSVKELNPSGYILSNGAYIEHNGKLLYSKPFDKQIFNQLKEYCDNNNGLFTGETQDFMYSPYFNDRFINYLKKWKLDHIKIKNESEGVTFYKCGTNFESQEDSIKFYKAFEGIVDHRVQTADPERLSYDINELGVNKGSAVDITIEKLGINKEDTYCFCDGTNDIELAKACKNSYVMENGDEGLKKIAFGLAKDVIEDGVYYKLVELGLIKEKK